MYLLLWKGMISQHFPSTIVHIWHKSVPYSPFLVYGITYWHILSSKRAKTLDLKKERTLLMYILGGRHVSNYIKRQIFILNIFVYILRWFCFVTKISNTLYGRWVSLKQNISNIKLANQMVNTKKGLKYNVSKWGKLW